MGYDMKKNIFIIGARGYHYNYGGWETFVDNLVVIIMIVILIFMLVNLLVIKIVTKNLLKREKIYIYILFMLILKVVL